MYLCEDLHTSYWSDWGGGYRKRGSFIEYSKNFIDYINAWHSKTNKLSVTEFTKSVHSLHYYDSVLAIEKRAIDKPYALKTGTPKILEYKPPENSFKRIKTKLTKRIRRLKKRFT